MQKHQKASHTNSTRQGILKMSNNDSPPLRATFSSQITKLNRKQSDSSMNLAVDELRTKLQNQKNLDEFCERQMLDQITFSSTGKFFDFLYFIASRAPLSFTPTSAKKFSELIPEDPKKCLTILAVYSKSFEEIEDPWPMLDLLYGDEFLEKSIASDYVTLLAYMVVNFVNFRKSRASACWVSICKALSIKNSEIVITCYECLAQITDAIQSQFKIPMDVVQSHFKRENLHDAMLTFLIRVPPKKCSPQFISSVVDNAKKNFKWTLLLYKLASFPNNALILVENAEWLLDDLPTPLETVQLFAIILSHKILRDSVTFIPNLAEFFQKMLGIKKEGIITIICLFIRRIPFNEDLIEAFSQLDLWNSIFKITFNTKDSVLIQQGFLIVDIIAKVCYIKELSIACPALVAHMQESEKLCVLAVSTAYVIAKYERCAIKLSKLNVESILRKYKNVEIKKKAERLINRINRYT